MKTTKENTPMRESRRDKQRGTEFMTFITFLSFLLLMAMALNSSAGVIKGTTAKSTMTTKNAPVKKGNVVTLPKFKTPTAPPVKNTWAVWEITETPSSSTANQSKATKAPAVMRINDRRNFKMERQRTSGQR